MNRLTIQDEIGTLVSDLTEHIFNLFRQRLSAGGNFFLAVSGGNTPPVLFREMVRKQDAMPYWDKLHVFWVDERCVAPDHDQSNYGMTFENLLSEVPVHENRIHRMRGEENPLEEAERYGSLIGSLVPSSDSVPVFDLIILGMGSDGHTASIFPGRTDLFDSGNNCEVSVHPETGQKRVTMTGRILNNARHVIFMVSGRDKAEMLRMVLKGERGIDHPASLVRPVHGTLEWYIDEQAAWRL